jgi:hypothetical protein
MIFYHPGQGFEVNAMKFRWLCVFLILALLFPEQSVFAHPETWDDIAEGVAYQRYVTPEPNQIYVVRMERGHPDLFLESAIGSGELAAGRETVSGMVDRYSEAINDWGDNWGGRNHIIAAINGDYFDPNTGYPENGMFQSGWYVKRYNDYEGWSGFVWKEDGGAFIGQCVKNLANKQSITVLENGHSQRIDNVNAARGGNDLIIYTPQYARTTQTDPNGLEVVVEMGHPLSVVPEPHGAVGVVTEVRPDKGSTPIPFDSIVISAAGGARESLEGSIQVGDNVQITQEITSLNKDCNGSLPNTDFTNAYAGIGGAFTYLADGQPQHLEVIGATARYPRTSIAMNDQYIYFIVVDGRQPGVSIGMSLDELATFARDELGATWAIAQDGGGSSTMVINDQVVNTPSDPCHSVYMPYVNKPAVYRPDQVFGAETDVTDVAPATDGKCERAVSNGMMIVQQEPMQRSNSFAEGSVVDAVQPFDLRLGPGTNYGSLGTVAAGDEGQVLAESHGLNGVLAKGENWWRISIDGQTGWAPEAGLARNLPLRPDRFGNHFGLGN